MNLMWWHFYRDWIISYMLQSICLVYYLFTWLLFQLYNYFEIEQPVWLSLFRNET